jgi:hypothetical protein
VIVTDEQWDQVFRVLTACTPAVMDEDKALGWELVFAGEDVTVREVQLAIAGVAKRQTWCSPAEALAEIRAQRQARRAAAEVHSAARPALEVGEPVYPAGHPQAGKAIDPEDDKPAYQEAMRARRFAAAVSPDDQDRSADLARLIPGWPGRRAIGDGR